VRHGGAQLLGRLEAAGTVGVGQQRDELLAAVAPDEVAGAQRALQRLRGRGQDVVADLVAEVVVERLEAIEVDHDPLAACRCAPTGPPSASARHAPRAHWAAR
jgi:hypothetical protein